MSFPRSSPSLTRVFAAGARVVHIDLDAYEIGKNFPVDLGLVSDPKLTLAALAVVLGQQLTPAAAQAAAARIEARREERVRAAFAMNEADLEARRSVPLHASEFMEALAKRLPMTPSSSTRRSPSRPR